MRLLLYIFLLLIAGCSTFQIANGLYASEEFDHYLEAYLDDKQFYLETRKVNYPIKFYFDDLDSPTLGRCETTKVTEFNGQVHFRKKIIIDIDLWINARDCVKKLVIYHELGHCDLDLPHNDKELSIMNTTISFLSPHFCKNEEKYIEELFLK